ncbi:DUF3558 family protein [Sciscionella sediminilitoris]|uniref:DUF3558 family protein n=1 Tax=Sciscionella sediminilitoris TaxID=1445613 RepID=UPI0004DED137|nr:DUF3558 family protein [Sciscionella sp. SE31]
MRNVVLGLSGVITLVLLAGCAGGAAQESAAPQSKQPPGDKVDCAKLAPAEQIGTALGKPVRQEQLPQGMSRFPSCSLMPEGGGLVSVQWPPKAMPGGKPASFHGNAASVRTGGGVRQSACALDITLNGDTKQVMTVNVDLYGKAGGDPCQATRKVAGVVFDRLT